MGHKEALVRIERLAHGGSGVGRVDGKAIFVPFGAPGDLALVSILEDKPRFSRGRIIELKEPSPLRVKPVCPVYKLCGGCDYQHISYASELEWKDIIFKETLKRIGKVDFVDFDRPIASPLEYGYRNRARFWCDGSSIGFYEAGSKRVVDVESCPLLDERLNLALMQIRTALLPGVAGHVESIELEAGDEGVFAAFTCDGRADKLINALKGRPPALCGYAIKNGDRVVAGEGVVSLTLHGGGLAFKGGGAFTQVNRAINELLIGVAVEYVGLTPEDTLLDLYCGSGNLTLPLSIGALRAIGVESSCQSVAYARDNAQLNKLNTVEIHHADARAWFSKHFADLEKQRPRVVLLDPPRSGAPEVSGLAVRLGPERVVYISCDPATLARDVSVFVKSGYTLSRGVMLDMFPRTAHAEAAVLLERKRSGE